MNKTYSIFIVALLLCSSVGAWAQKQKMLTILHTNDTHSTIFPLSEMLSDTMTAGRGGFMRRVAMIKEERAKDPDLLLFDSGDFSQGSAYYTLYKGDVESGLMNLMHYDAGTIGNHEFDFGLDNMARVFRRLNFPILCANYDFTGTELDGLVKPYVILKRKGLKIGVFGLCPELDGLVDHKNFEPIRYHDPIAAAREMVQTLRAKQALRPDHLSLPSRMEDRGGERRRRDSGRGRHRPGAGWTQPQLFPPDAVCQGPSRT